MKAPSTLTSDTRFSYISVNLLIQTGSSAENVGGAGLVNDELAVRRGERAQVE